MGLENLCVVCPEGEPCPRCPGDHPCREHMDSVLAHVADAIPGELARQGRRAGLNFQEILALTLKYGEISIGSIEDLLDILDARKEPA